MLRNFFCVLLCAASPLLSSEKAIIFDFGGVLCHKPTPKPIIKYLCTSLDLSPEEFKRANSEKRAALKAGIPEELYWKFVAEKNAVTLEDNWLEGFIQSVRNSLDLNTETYLIVEKLKTNGHTVGILSNIYTRYSKHIQIAGGYDPFDPVLLSCDIGVEKPNAKAYQILLDRLNMQADQIIFIDDTKENVAAAKALGIDAIHFTSAHNLEVELAKRDLL